MSAPQFSFLADAAGAADESGIGLATWKYIGRSGSVESLELRATFSDAWRLDGLIETAHKAGQREGAESVKRAVDTALREILK